MDGASREPPSPAESGSPGQAPHRLVLAPGWEIWRTTALRSAGFPYRRLAALANEDAVAAVVALMVAERTFGERRTQHIGSCIEALPGDCPRERRLLQKAIGRLKRGGIPAKPPDTPSLQGGFQKLLDARARVEEAQQALAGRWAQASERTGEAVHQVARDPLFREALVWQNRRVLDTAIGPLLRRSPLVMDSDNRQAALLVVRYLQRYCAKNDTIGFFGPVAWATLGDGPQVLRSRPGPALVADRFIHFEHWTIDSLVDALMGVRELGGWLSPRLAPTWRLSGSELIGPGGRRIPLMDLQRLVLGALDGHTRVRDLPRTLGLETPQAEQELGLFLASLADTGVVIWRPALPVVRTPEQRLRAFLDGIGDPQLRDRLLAPLDELDRARDRVAASAGDAEALDAAMEGLERSFERITGAAPRRAAGQYNAGRTLVYEDCLRDVSCTLGAEFLARLGGPLSLLLTGARWFTWQLAAQYRDLVRSAYSACCAETGERRVSLQHLWMKLQAEQETLTMIVDDVVDQGVERWAPLLLGETGNGVRRVTLSLARLRPAVEAAFEAPGPGWPGARYHSPDVMIAAESAEAAREGRFTLVMGELHASGNTLLQAMWLALHPQPEALLGQVARDQPEAELVAAVSRRRFGHRMNYDPATPHDVHFEFDDTPSWRPPSQVTSIAELVVEDGPRGLEISTLDGVRRFPGIAFFGPQLRGFAARRQRLLPPRPHTPRVTIDHLVVVRESWHFEARVLEFANAGSGAERFAGAWRLAHAHGFPRWLFVRTSLEKKPVHVDLHSPMLVELLAKLVRAAAEKQDGWVSIAEMLPAPDQLWLEDADGERYTSEFRLVVLDERCYSPAGETNILE